MCIANSQVTRIKQAIQKRDLGPVMTPGIRAQSSQGVPDFENAMQKLAILAGWRKKIRVLARCGTEIASGIGIEGRQTSIDRHIRYGYKKR